MGYLRVLVSLLGLITLTVIRLPAAAQSDRESGGLIAYIELVDEVPDLFTMQADGSNPQQITGTPDITESTPAWSPDGSTLAYSATQTLVEEPVYGIYVMSLEEADFQLLADTPGQVTSLDWSPDGATLLFSVYQPDGGSLYTLNRDGSDLTMLVDDESVAAAAWSPDGTQIYASRRNNGGEVQLYRMDADGSHLQRLSNRVIAASPMDWSPDGSTALLVVNNDNGEDASLVVSDASFEQLEVLVENDVLLNGRASWSPDGTQIVFDYVLGGQYVVDVETGDLTELTALDETGMTTYSAWQPGGRAGEIVFGEEGSDTVVGEGNVDDTATNDNPDTDARIVFVTRDQRIATVNTDGDDLQYLTDSADYVQPRWSPDGTMIAYGIYTDSGTIYYVMNRDGSSTSKVGKCNNYMCSVLTWSPDSTKLAYASTDGFSEAMVTIIDLVTGDEDALATFENAFFVNPPGWSPDGSKIAFYYNTTLHANGASADGTVPAIINVKNGKVTVYDKAGNEMGWYGVPVWSDDGTEIILGTSFDTTSTLDVQSGRVTNAPYEPPEIANVVKTLPDGNLVSILLSFDESDTSYPTVFTLYSPDGEVIKTVDIDGFDADWGPAVSENVGGDLAALMGGTGGTGSKDGGSTDDGGGPGGGAEFSTDIPAGFTQTVKVESCEVRAPRIVNLRGGPGKDYRQVGTLDPGETATADLQAREGTMLWWRLGEDGWVRWDVVEWETACQYLPREGDDAERFLLVPDDRETAPDEARLLRDGISMVTNRPTENGEIQIEYYCGVRGFQAEQGKKNWGCNSGGKQVFRLDIPDYDLICQQTYWNSFAFAIQDGRRSQPSLNWRCYEIR